MTAKRKAYSAILLAGIFLQLTRVEASLSGSDGRPPVPDFGKLLAESGSTTTVAVATEVKCSTCGQDFSTKNTLRRHQKLHTGELAFKCPTCEKGFYRSDHLRIHMTIHDAPGGKFKCSICGLKYATRASLARHKRNHADKRVVCPVCGANFARADIFKKHFSSVHTGERTHECLTCGKRFFEKASLKKHLRVHLPGPKFKCSICGSEYLEKSNLRRHQKIHTGDSSKSGYAFECPTCNKIFSQKHAFNQHQKTHTGVGPLSPEAGSSRSSPSPDSAMRPFSPQAGSSRTSTSQGAPRTATETTHTIADHSRPEVVWSGFKCSTCGKGFASKITLGRHQKLHTGDQPHKCPTCGKGFTQNLRMEQHMWIHHMHVPNQ